MPEEALVGKPIDILLTGPSRILFQTNIYPALSADGLVEEALLTLVTADGDVFPVLFNAIRRGDGADVRYDALIVRIRARSRWENDLLAATRALEQERAEGGRLAAQLQSALDEVASRVAGEERTQRLRDAFAGVVSHELRTPITTIYGMGTLLRQRHRTMDADAVEAHLGDIENEAERLHRLTENLLVLSRAEGGRLQVEMEPLAIGHIVRRTVESVEARSRSHPIEVAIDLGVPLVLGDESSIEQVVRNFLSNAAKYTPAGSPVRLELTGVADGVELRVIDSGPGLPNDATDRLFELFYRDPQAVRQAAGAGIGLFVCRELIVAMGGRIWARPAPPPAEHGAEFGFWLPAIDEEPDWG